MGGGTYRLVTTWVLPRPPEEVWPVLTDPGLGWARWWPGLVAVPDGVPVAGGPECLVGRRARVRVRAAAGAYLLRFGVRVAEAQGPVRAVLDVRGDLIGTGVATLTGTPGGGCVVRLDWRVRTARGWMNRTSWLLAPVFRAAHRRVMRRGERGLRRYLATVRGGSADGVRGGGPPAW